jgi:hypothetical protein
MNRGVNHVRKSDASGREKSPVAVALPRRYWVLDKPDEFTN